MVVSYKTQELALNCILLTETTNNKLKMKSYIIVTLFHGHSREFKKHKADLDARGSARANFQFDDINVESAYLRFQVFIHSKFFPDKLFGQVNNVRVSELLVSSSVNDNGNGKISQETYATYDIVKLSKKGDLKLCYKLKLSIGNDDTGLFKTTAVPSFRTPLVSLRWTTPEDLVEVVGKGKSEIVSSNSLDAAIGNEIGLFKTVPSFRKPLISLSWD